MNPFDAVNAVTAGIGVILQYGRSFGMSLKSAAWIMVVMAVVLSLAANQDLTLLIHSQYEPGLTQRFVLSFLVQFVGVVASGFGGLFGAEKGAQQAVAMGANASHPLVPVKPEAPDA